MVKRERGAAAHPGVFWTWWAAGTTSAAGSAVGAVALPLTALTVLDAGHVVGVEFNHTKTLGVLGVDPPPALRDNSEYRPGMLVG